MAQELKEFRALQAKNGGWIIYGAGLERGPGFRGDEYAFGSLDDMLAALRGLCSEAGVDDGQNIHAANAAILSNSRVFKSDIGLINRAVAEGR